jgi:hypothetical protein
LRPARSCSRYDRQTPSRAYRIAARLSDYRRKIPGEFLCLWVGRLSLRFLFRRAPQVLAASSLKVLQLEKRAGKYTLAYLQVQRAEMILLAAEGLSNDQIAARLDTRREVVCFWRKRFFAERLTGLEERSRPGRPRTFSPCSGSSGEGLGFANSQPRTTCPCLAGVPPIWPERLVRSSRAIPTSLTKPAACWTCTPANGKVSR